MMNYGKKKPMRGNAFDMMARGAGAAGSRKGNGGGKMGAKGGGKGGAKGGGKKGGYR